MFGAIILRDIPKEEVRIDLSRHPIQGGFRGFRTVPVGLHYVSVKSGEHHTGFWCWMRPKQAIVKIFDYEKGFLDADPGSATHYTNLALSGAMDHALIQYPHEKFGPWYGLIHHIDPTEFPPRIHSEDAGEGSRLDKVLQNTHQGDYVLLLAEFQFAFARWLVSLDTATTDDAAHERWRHLLLAAYNAGEDRIRESGALFPDLVDALLQQFPLLPDEWFEPATFLTAQAGYLSEDMIDTEVDEIAAKGRAFADYLKTRAPQ